MSGLLHIENLGVTFPSRHGDFQALSAVDLQVQRGQIHGLVGQSGAGKSTIGAAVIGLLSAPGYISEGELLLDGVDLRALSPKQAHALRGDRISMIFQDPQTSLNPLMTVEQQLVETIQSHRKLDDAAALARAIELLTETGIENAAVRIKAYPHQFSGGMRQRVVIALAICTDPELIIADEPTTALDVAVQSQVLDLLKDLARRRKIGFLLITHDIGVIAQVADVVTVLRDGRLVEHGPTAQVLQRPRESYTRSLMAAVPRLDKKLARFLNPETVTDTSINGNATIVSNGQGAKAEQWLMAGEGSVASSLLADNITVKFAGQRQSLWRQPEPFVALQDVSIEARAGKVLGIVGESGSGKSTLAKVITGLINPNSGTLTLDEQLLPTGKARSRQHPSRRWVQMVFQDPYSSLNARHRIGDILAEPLQHFALESDRNKRRELVQATLDLVGLDADQINRYPHQFSGGQRQRIAIARALLARPKVLLCDEPTSALDVSIQAQVLNLLKDLQAQFGLTIIFISHNLAVVRQMADDIVVLRNGQVIESGDSESFFNQPSADYSKELLALTPSAFTSDAHKS